MHDDQHGTATVTLAAIISAMRMTGKTHDGSLVVGQIGLGAAGLGISRLLIDYGLKVTGTDLNPDSQKRLLDYGGKIASLADTMKEADIVVSTTGVPGLIKPEMVRKGQIILALSNPEPEISPDEALAAGAAFADDGRTINNALAYPGLFKAALLGGAHGITPAMKIAAAKAISVLADEDELVPSIFNPKVHDAVVKAVLAAI
jgi:malate dehydrogenase (oxaloacetate-decarboxylating)